jgi:hypothetical protein
MIETGITSIVLPTGQVVTVNEVRTFNFNQHVNSLRFSFEAPTTKPSGVDSLSGWIRGIDTDLGRVAVLAHRYFKFRDTLYVTDATIKQLVRP